MESVNLSTPVSRPREPGLAKDRGSQLLVRSDRCDLEDETRMLATVMEALDATGYAALRALVAEITEGVVTLRGVLPSFYLYQVAQESVFRIDGVEHIRNLVRVESPVSTRTIES